MSGFITAVKEIITEYGITASDLSVMLAIETYRDLRNYPKYYTDEKILADMESNKNKIAMAAVEIDAKEGVEGQTSHNDNGTNRGYGTLPLPKAYATVVPFAKVI